MHHAVSIHHKPAVNVRHLVTTLIQSQQLLISALALFPANLSADWCSEGFVGPFHLTSALLMLTSVAPLRCSPANMLAPPSAWQPRQVQHSSQGTYHSLQDPTFTPDSSSALMLSIPHGVTKAPISALPASLQALPASIQALPASFEPLASQTKADSTVPVVTSTATGPSAFAYAPADTAEPLDVMLTLLDSDVTGASMPRQSSLTLSRGLSVMLDLFYSHGKDGQAMKL